jgi:hypothetical protein
VFDEINGLPAHPLVVHGAVVLVPLLCLTAIAFALLPRVRGQVWWAAAGLALGLVTLVLVLFTSARLGGGRRMARWLSIVLAAAVVILAAADLYFVVRTGDSGAKSVWGGS